MGFNTTTLVDNPQQKIEQEADSAIEKEKLKKFHEAVEQADTQPSDTESQSSYTFERVELNSEGGIAYEEDQYSLHPSELSYESAFDEGRFAAQDQLFRRQKDNQAVPQESHYDLCDSPDDDQSTINGEPADQQLSEHELDDDQVMTETEEEVIQEEETESVVEDSELKSSKLHDVSDLHQIEPVKSRDSISEEENSPLIQNKAPIVRQHDRRQVRFGQTTTIPRQPRKTRQHDKIQTVSPSQQAQVAQNDIDTAKQKLTSNNIRLQQGLETLKRDMEYYARGLYREIKHEVNDHERKYAKTVSDDSKECAKTRLRILTDIREIYSQDLKDLKVESVHHAIAEFLRKNLTFEDTTKLKKYLGLLKTKSTTLKTLDDEFIKLLIELLKTYHPSVQKSARKATQSKINQNERERKEVAAMELIIARRKHPEEIVAQTLEPVVEEPDIVDRPKYEAGTLSQLDEGIRESFLSEKRKAEARKKNNAIYNLPFTDSFQENVNTDSKVSERWKKIEESVAFLLSNGQNAIDEHLPKISSEADPTEFEKDNIDANKIKWTQQVQRVADHGNDIEDLVNQAHAQLAHEKSIEESTFGVQDVSNAEASVVMTQHAHDDSQAVTPRPMSPVSAGEGPSMHYATSDDEAEVTQDVSNPIGKHKRDSLSSADIYPEDKEPEVSGASSRREKRRHKRSRYHSGTASQSMETASLQQTPLEDNADQQKETGVLEKIVGFFGGATAAAVAEQHDNTEEVRHDDEVHSRSHRNKRHSRSRGSRSEAGATEVSSKSRRRRRSRRHHEKYGSEVEHNSQLSSTRSSRESRNEIEHNEQRPNSAGADSGYSTGPHQTGASLFEPVSETIKPEFSEVQHPIQSANTKPRSKRDKRILDWAEDQSDSYEYDIRLDASIRSDVSNDTDTIAYFGSSSESEADSVYSAPVKTAVRENSHGMRDRHIQKDKLHQKQSSQLVKKEHRDSGCFISDDLPEHVSDVSSNAIATDSASSVRADEKRTKPKYKHRDYNSELDIGSEASDEATVNVARRKKHKKRVRRTHQKSEISLAKEPTSSVSAHIPVKVSRHNSQTQERGGLRNNLLSLFAVPSEISNRPSSVADSRTQISSSSRSTTKTQTSTETKRKSSVNGASFFSSFSAYQYCAIVYDYSDGTRIFKNFRIKGNTAIKLHPSTIAGFIEAEENKPQGEKRLPPRERPHLDKIVDYQYTTANGECYLAEASRWHDNTITDVEVYQVLPNGEEEALDMTQPLPEGALEAWRKLQQQVAQLPPPEVYLVNKLRIAYQATKPVERKPVHDLENDGVSAYSDASRVSRYDVI